MIDAQASAAIQPLLAPGERILWSGRPKQGLVLHGYDGFLIPFSIIWSGGVIAIFSLALTGGAPAFIIFFAIPFLLVAFFLLFGRFWIDMRRRRHTVYAITPDRVLISQGSTRKNLSSLYIDQLSAITYSERSDSSGSLVFNNENSMGWNRPFFMRQAIGWNRGNIYAFENIPDVNQVYRLIQEQRGRHGKSPV